MNNLAESTLHQPDVRSVIILNADDQILSAVGEMPRALIAGSSTLRGTGNLRWQPQVDTLLAKVNRDTPIFDGAGSVLFYQAIEATPLALDDLADNASAHQVGTVIVELSWQRSKSLKARLLWFTLIATALFVMLTLYLVHLASRRLVESITRLSEAVQAIGSGDLETRVVISSSINELCTLNDGINQMMNDLRGEREVLQQRIDEATTQLRSLAFYDTLTLLPNRRLFTDRLVRALAASKRNQHFGAVMFLDLDNFKPLNDRYGHSVGDLLLYEVARRIPACLREMDTVARLGGDEFVVLLPELSADHQESLDEARIVAEKIRKTLSEPYPLSYRKEGTDESSIEHHCSSSIGVVIFIGNDLSPDEILLRADAAMYEAKEMGRNSIRLYQGGQISVAIESAGQQ